MNNGRIAYICGQEEGENSLIVEFSLFILNC